MVGGIAVPRKSIPTTAPAKRVRFRFLRSIVFLALLLVVPSSSSSSTESTGSCSKIHGEAVSYLIQINSTFSGHSAEGQKHLLSYHICNSGGIRCFSYFSLCKAMMSEGEMDALVEQRLPWYLHHEFDLLPGPPGIPNPSKAAEAATGPCLNPQTRPESFYLGMIEDAITARERNLSLPISSNCSALPANNAVSIAIAKARELSVLVKCCDS